MLFIPSHRYTNTYYLIAQNEIEVEAHFHMIVGRKKNKILYVEFLHFLRIFLQIGIYNYHELYGNASQIGKYLLIHDLFQESHL